jgi:hypothetical protein
MKQDTLRSIALISKHNTSPYIGIGSCKQESNLRKKKHARCNTASRLETLRIGILLFAPQESATP